MGNKKQQTLTDNTWLRYFNFIALYFAQGVPEGMLLFGIPAWMAMNGKSPNEIAAFAIACGIPWSFKFIVAPLMDRYTYLPMGRKRPWVILGQLGLVSSCVYMAYVHDPLNNLNQFMIAGFLVSFFGAFQDVATDGMAVDIIPDEQQAKANGFMWGSKIIGISTSLAIGTWLTNTYGFTEAILVLSMIIALIMLVPLFVRERKGEKLTPWTRGVASTETQNLQLDNWSTIFKSLYSVFKLRNSILLTIVLFISQGAFNYMGTLLPIFTIKELGWTNISYSQYYATAKLIGGIGGMLIGGILIDKFGIKRMMNLYFILMIAFTIALVSMKLLWSSNSFIYGYMILYNIFYTFSCIGIFALAMQCCWKKVSASQFTLYMTISNIGRVSIAALIGPIKANFDWEITLMAFALLMGLCLLFLQLFNVKTQVLRVAELERKDNEGKILQMAAN